MGYPTSKALALRAPQPQPPQRSRQEACSKPSPAELRTSVSVGPAQNRASVNIYQMNEWLPALVLLLFSHTLVLSSYNETQAPGFCPFHYGVDVGPVEREGL